MKLKRALLLSLVLVMALSVAASATKYNEAPELAKLVKDGKLPPVEQRLPNEPLVVQVVEEIGQYGGIWRRAAVSAGDVQLTARLTYEGLVRWNADGSDVMPNVAKSYTVNEDGTVFTFYLREGMKWSDGQPFTANDFEFWWNDVILNTDLYPVVPEWLTINGKPAEFTKVDDYTIRFTFAEPYGLFLRQMAYQSEGITQFPKHYLKQFHANYAPVEELNAKAKEGGREFWYQMFNDMKDPRRNIDCPVIWAWRVTVPQPAMNIVAERNPYYWKVDAEGNQLPYIDRITHDIVENPQVLNLKAASGEIDMQLRHILWDNLPVFAESMERNNFRILQWQAAEPNNLSFYPNMFHKDEVLRKLFRDKRFRQALSLAMDREEINQLAYIGLGRGRQGGVIPASPFNVEGSELKYATQNLKEANRLLDEVGLTKRDKEGFRLRPDGERLSINIMLSPVFGPWPKVGELVVDYWSKVGIRASLDVVERTLMEERARGLEFDWSAWMNDRGLTPDVDPMLLLPGRGQGVDSPWFNWFNTQGARGEEPPAGPEKEAYDLYAKVKMEKDPAEVAKLMQEIIRLNTEELWYIGTVGDLPHVVIVKNDMRNVPDVAVSDWLQKTPGNTWPEQYFKKQK